MLNLLSFKPGTPGTIDTSTPITGLGGGENVLGIDFRQTNGKLYAATTAGRVYTIDPTSAVATLVSNLAPDATDTTNPFAMLAGNAFGVDFNPVADRLRIVSDTGQSLRINVDTGFVTTDTNLNPGTPQVVAVAYRASYPLTAAIESQATTLDEIVAETLGATTSERQGRIIDHDGAGSMERKKQEGYF